MSTIYDKALPYLDDYSKTLADIAEAINVSRRSLRSALAYKKYNMGARRLKVNEYVLNQKTEKAKVMLNAGWPIRNVCFELAIPERKLKERLSKDGFTVKIYQPKKALTTKSDVFFTTMAGSASLELARRPWV
jgi:hypothetical protein